MSLNIRNIMREYDVILASSSPRRRELIKLICPQARILPPDCDERLPADTRIEKAAEYLSDLKCRSVAEKFEDSVVIGCDTIVISDGAIFGKPKDEQDAKRMLLALSGKEHHVISGVTIGYKKKFLSFSVSTGVTFRALSEEDIDLYISSGEPMDKAGAYAIQGLGSLMVAKIDGEFYNVVGLPVSEIAEKLDSFLLPE